MVGRWRFKKAFSSFLCLQGILITSPPWRNNNISRVTGGGVGDCRSAEKEICRKGDLQKYRSAEKEISLAKVSSKSPPNVVLQSSTGFYRVLHISITFHHFPSLSITFP